MCNFSVLKIVNDLIIKKVGKMTQRDKYRTGQIIVSTSQMREISCRLVQPQGLLALTPLCHHRRPRVFNDFLTHNFKELCFLILTLQR